MAASADLCSRSQICRKYGITEKTLRSLEEDGILDLAWKARNGLLVADVSAVKHRRVLTAARNHIDTFGRAKNIDRVPFQRFLFLRFLQLPVEDIYEEILGRNLIHKRGFPVSRLKEMRDAFIEEVPRPLRKKVASGKEATTDTEKKQLEILLQVCGISLAYAHPELEQGFACLSDSEVKLALDIGLSTASTIPDIRAFLEDVASFTIPKVGLLFYSTLFYDLSFLDSDEVQSYLKALKPSSRRLIQRALGQSLQTLRMSLGLSLNRDAEEALYELRDRALTDVYASMLEPRNIETDREFNVRLKNLLMLIDRTTMSDGPGGGGGGTQLPSVFDRLEMKTSNMSGTLFQLPQPESDAEKNSG
jgi:hypothetical protein